MPDHAMSKWLRYDIKEGKEDETNGKIVQIRQENQAEETVARNNKASRKDDKKKSITVNGNGKWCAQDKNTNNINPVSQKKDAYDDFTYKYLQKIKYSLLACRYSL